MMLSAIADLYSWTTAVGFAGGLGAQRAYCYAKIAWLDRYRPLPDGKRRRVRSLDRVWLAGLVTVVFMGWCVFEIQNTDNEMTQLARDTQDCQRQFNEALTERSKITTENDELSQRERTALASWLHDLLFPPPGIAELGRDDPRYKSWAVNLTEQYYDILADAEAKQAANAQWRKDHPFPEPTCGK